MFHTQQAEAKDEIALNDKNQLSKSKRAPNRIFEGAL